MNNKKILVLGSGPTGLIAWKLLKGFNVTVIEKNSVSGGYADHET